MKNRVAITPAGVVHLVRLGHEVVVQRGPGLGSGLPMRPINRPEPGW
ncbi:hypothetical protein ACFSJU_13270 [Paradesertivirga mongoliensis]|uniref:Alanine dehydrogenase/pyridine nucleotide transhydrogenase N-terminal domain-containing protein n=1 Tax=Paradesertivirga mongoliensis TaxID=2100740 RepID=A0ABW4ZNG0_9SPHI|nr:hypothetical protein [Pedobacter mongoliensis]